MHTIAAAALLATAHALQLPWKPAAVAAPPSAPAAIAAAAMVCIVFVPAICLLLQLTIAAHCYAQRL